MPIRPRERPHHRTTKTPWPWTCHPSSWQKNLSRPKTSIDHRDLRVGALGPVKHRERKHRATPEEYHGGTRHRDNDRRLALRLLRRRRDRRHRLGQARGRGRTSACRCRRGATRQRGPTVRTKRRSTRHLLSAFLTEHRSTFRGLAFVTAKSIRPHPGSCCAT